ncbi:hypothetical protein J7361_04430, partial [Xanthomonas phaseoli pv. dieffenbachiae]|uniref:hypothetical protein n=1 Tax=Xanthomonas phaseoli TaxID=1985254 RepID=UPI001ADC79D1
GEAGCLHGTSSEKGTRKFHFWRQLTCGGITEVPVAIKLVSTGPHAWVVSAKSDIAPDIRTDDLYILKGDHLVISDGESVKQYRRCK